jgi:hypothetical protein
MDLPSDDLETLRRQMHEIRNSMVGEVHELVENARSATDWRHYWRTHPWAWCTAAAALGYLAVPSRRIGNAEVRSPGSLTQPAPSNPPSSVIQRVLAEVAGMAIGFVAQRGMQLVGDRLESLLATQNSKEERPRQTNERASQVN